jgi:hypothetical protein
LVEPLAICFGKSWGVVMLMPLFQVKGSRANAKITAKNKMTAFFSDLSHPTV